MSAPAWVPWHKVVRVRDDIRSGELSLAMFAADLHSVASGNAGPVYQDPREFFALTYATFNLRELAKDVVLRLAGRNEKAVRQLELTYGGGKTHTLIALYHLVSDPDNLPDLPAVHEFTQHIGVKPPRARIAVLSLDKLDVEKGMKALSPNREERWLRNPWSVLAFQIAGSNGLKLLHPDDRDDERETPPAENLMIELLSLPQREGLSTLVLIDEVLMYAREKVGLAPVWRSRLVDFFQYLTQAATKVDRCAVVASLLATDPRKSDTLGKELTQELYAIFRREREEGVQPVLKDDVAEVLRRRFFTQESIRDREAFRPHVVAAINGVLELDEQSRRDQHAQEERFLRSYPFHPDLTDVFYSKWTNLEGFQRTRGILRTFALALRGAEQWDESPLIAAGAFLVEPSKTGISDATRELAMIAAAEEYEGKKQEWTAILDGELAKACEVQKEHPSLAYREIEEAVLATFLHSQPIGQKASIRDLMLLLGPTRPDHIDLEKALIGWSDVSWFLDEGLVQGAGEGAGDGQKQVPKHWRLGSRPNLRQMHFDACSRVSPDLVDARLIDEVGKVKSLIAGVSAASATPHMLPAKPGDVKDDGDFHFAVLGLRAASDVPAPSAEARRYIDETTGPDRPRVNRNAVVLVVPSRDGLEAARTAVRNHLGWLDVQKQLKDQKVTDTLRDTRLAAHVSESQKKIPDMVRQAWCVVVTVSTSNQVVAFRITPGDQPLFTQVKADKSSRILDTAINHEALLPGGPYDLWREGETSRRVRDLVGAFAQFSHLPKMLNRQAIVNTLVKGCEDRLFVLRLVRPDRSVRTFWGQAPDQAMLDDPALEVVLPASAELSDLSPSALLPGQLPSLWDETPALKVGDIYGYFVGGHQVQVPREGYADTLVIPRVSPGTIDLAVRASVKEGRLWFTLAQASLLGEEIPQGLAVSSGTLQPPPVPFAPQELLPQQLPDAWSDSSTTAYALSIALSQKTGKILPWITVRNAIDGAIASRFIERTPDSGAWPTDFASAQAARFRISVAPPGPPRRPGSFRAQATLNAAELQDLAERIGEVVSAGAGLDIEIEVGLDVTGVEALVDDRIEKINAVLAKVVSGLALRRQ